jgi:hypothetical protein
MSLMWSKRILCEQLGMLPFVSLVRRVEWTGKGAPLDDRGDSVVF